MIRKSLRNVGQFSAGTGKKGKRKGGKKENGVTVFGVEAERRMKYSRPRFGLCFSLVYVGDYG